MTTAFKNLADNIERVVHPCKWDAEGTAGCQLSWPEWQMVLDALRAYTTRMESARPEVGEISPTLTVTGVDGVPHIIHSDEAGIAAIVDCLQRLGDLDKQFMNKENS